MSRRRGRRIKLDTPGPAFARVAAELNEHVARHGADKVAVVLRVPVADLEPMLAGRVMPGRNALYLLRRLT